MYGNTSVTLNTFNGRVKLGVWHFAALGTSGSRTNFYCDDCDPQPFPASPTNVSAREQKQGLGWSAPTPSGRA